MSGTLREQNEMRIAEEAAEWLGVLERGKQEDCAAFAKWITASRTHVEEFLLASAVDKVLDRVDIEQRIDVDEVLRRAHANVLPLAPALPANAAPRERGGSSKWLWTLAACTAAASIGAGLLLHPPGTQDYRTTVGQQQTVRLPDGSSFYLNTQSRARVHYTDRGRDVELVSGEALFDVKHDAARPFRVRSGKATIQALGTQFNVYRRSQATTVAVVEGVVRISTRHDSSELVAAPEKNLGEEARIAANGDIVQHRPVEARRVAAWRQRRLMFRADTLADIAAEFNRYNDKPQIRVEGDEVRARRFSGVFNANDPRALVQFLDSYGDLKAQERDGVLVIRGKSAASGYKAMEN